MGWNFKRKYPEVPIGTLPTWFKPASSFAGVVWLDGLRNLLGATAVIIGVASSFALLMGNLWIERTYGRPPQWVAVLAVYLVTPILSGLLAWRLFQRGYRKRLEKDDRGSVRSPAPDAIYAGVSFCEGVWQIGSHQSWCKGFLSVESDGILFNAWTGGFMLPYGAIRDIQIRFVRAFSLTPRVFIEWQHPSGRINTLSFEDLRPENTLDTLESLRSHLQLKLPGVIIPHFDERALPLESSTIQFPDTPANNQSYFFERAMAFCFVFVAIIPLVSLENYLGRFADEHLIHPFFLIGTVLLMQLFFNRLIFSLTRFRRKGFTLPTNPA